MREILFRGKRVDNGEWVEGYYCPYCFSIFPCTPAIVPKNEMEKGHWSAIEVDPETVGQYTGITDSQQNMVFDGDIIAFDFCYQHCDVHYVLNVLYTEGRYVIDCENVYWSVEDVVRRLRAVVIGNIHDNPKLMQKQGTTYERRHRKI